MNRGVDKMKHLPYEPLRITSPFGPRNTGIQGATKNHLGIDIGADRKVATSLDGGNVYAIFDGKVIQSYFNKYRGWVVLIDHGIINGKKICTLSQHLKSMGVPVGVKVKAGDVIGRMGKTGIGSGLHLHFEVRENNIPVNPMNYLK